MSSPPARRPALPALTGIRFFAAMAVFFFHFGAALSMRLGAPAPLTQLLKNGYLGVSVFFVLSGFIMTYTYEGHLRSGTELRDYAWARFARIYPVYVLALVLALPVLEKPLDVPSAAKVLLMIQSWTVPTSSSGFAWVTHAWTLSVELFFYLMFPLLLRATRGWRDTPILLCVVILMIFIVTLGIPTIAPGYRGPVAYVSHWPLPVLRFSEFAYGFHVCKWMLSHPQITRRFGHTALTYCMLTAIAVLLCTRDGPHAMGCVTVLFGLLLLQLASGESGLSLFLSRRGLILLGGASYAIYLLQGPIRSWIQNGVPEPWAKPVQLALTLIGSIVVFMYFEEPLRMRLRHWNSSKGNR
jgi:peptidoglycan/LPS O-acetylase OafA/YrhL